MNSEFNALSRGLLRHPKMKPPICYSRPGAGCIGNPRTIGRSGCTPAEPYPPNRRSNIRQRTKSAIKENFKSVTHVLGRKCNLCVGTCM